MLPDVLDDAGAAQPAQPAVRRWRLRRRPRNTLLTIHIIVSVGLVGDTAGFLAVAIRRSLSNDPALVESSRELLGMFALYFGIPLSILALLTGAALGVLTRWGVFRYPWVTAKLALNLSVIVVGAIVLRPVMDDDARLEDTALIAGAAYDVAVLTFAAALSVFKPGRPFRRVRRESPARSSSIRPDDPVSKVVPCMSADWGIDHLIVDWATLEQLVAPEPALSASQGS